jgi:hypothetical protein
MREETKPFCEWSPSLQVCTAFIIADFCKVPGKSAYLMEILSFTNPVVTIGFSQEIPKYARVEKEESKSFQLMLEAFLAELQVNQWEKEVGDEDY